MRAKEFLSEATLANASFTSWPKYLQYLLNSNNLALGTSGERASGLALDNNSKKTIQQLISGFNSSPNKQVFGKQIEKTPIGFTDGTTATISQIFKSTDMKGKEEFNVRSKGLVVEALLGVAMYTKLIHRSGDFTQQISAQEVWNVVDRIKPTGDDKITDSVDDKNHKVSDTINLDIALATDIQHLLTDKSKRDLFDSDIASVLSYVNGSLAQKYADALYKNNRPDNVTIRMLGKEGGKIDVAINVLDSEGQSTRKLEQVKLSVKLSNSLIGQQARGRTAPEAFENLEELFKPLGISLKDKKEEIETSALMSGVQNQFADAMVLGYREAYQKLKSMADSTKDYVKLTEKLSKFIDWHTTKNDPEIQVVEFDSAGGHRILNYKGLYQVFKKENIEVDVRYSEGSSEKFEDHAFPSIKFVNLNMPGRSGLLAEIRFRTRGNYANHIIEPGPLLKELAAYSRYKKS